MMFILGMITGLWIGSLYVLWVEMRDAPLVDEKYEVPIIRRGLGDGRNHHDY